VFEIKIWQSGLSYSVIACTPITVASGGADFCKKAIRGTAEYTQCLPEFRVGDVSRFTLEGRAAEAEEERDMGLECA
jgi:hypothetical protein